MKSLIATLCCSACSFVLFAAEEEPHPNFIFFLSDDISQEDHGGYGHPVIKTPHIDALAANGMRFDNAYLAISSCSPSRCSIITGRYPHNTGAPELHSPLPGAAAQGGLLHRTVREKPHVRQQGPGV